MGNWKQVLRIAVEREHASEMRMLLQDTLETLQNMTTEEFQIGLDKPVRGRIEELLAKIDSESNPFTE